MNVILTPVALTLTALSGCVQHQINDPIIVSRETIAFLDRAYTKWYQAEALKATSTQRLNELTETEKTWELWFGRTVRLLMLTATEDFERKANQIAIENEIEQARRWLVALGVNNTKKEEKGN